MTHEELYALLKSTGIPFSYHHWEKTPHPPYGVYFDDYTENLFADDTVALEIQHFAIELYTAKLDLMSEKTIERTLNRANIPWEREKEWIESEAMYQTRYEIEV